MSETDTQRAAAAVIGVGNLLMGDEGVGCRLVQYLAADSAAFPGVEFLDMGAAGMNVAYEFTGRRTVLLIDCACMGARPGTMRRFAPAEVRSIKRLPGFSLHEGDLLKTIELAERIGDMPDTVILFGIEPERIAPGIGLSDTLERRVPDYAAAIKAELRARGIAEAPGA